MPSRDQLLSTLAESSSKWKVNTDNHSLEPLIEAREEWHKLLMVLKEIVVELSDPPVRVFRLIEYRGPRKWVEETVARSVHGTKADILGATITGVTINEFPES